MSVDNSPSVIQALSGVMDDVRAVPKGDFNSLQRYRFRGVDATVNAVGPALRKHGVVVVPVAEEIITEHYTSKNQTAMKSVVLKVRWRFYGPMGDHIEAVTYGEAADSGDKAVSKAHSVAFRTALLQALCLPTDEPDPDSFSPERGDEQPDGGVAVGVEEIIEIDKYLATCDRAGFQVQVEAMRLRWVEFTSDQRELVAAWVKAAELRLGSAEVSV